MSSSFFASFFGALQGAIQVLLTCFAGYIAAQRNLVDRNTVQYVSGLCSTIFLPALLIVDMGPELTPATLSKLWIIPAWGVLSTVIAHGFGYVGHKVLGLPHWTIVASGRANSSALPLLLVQSLGSTGVLKQFGDGDMVGKARSLVLLNVVVQQVITFQSAPWILERAKDDNDSDEEEGLAQPSGRVLPTVVQDRERVGLLDSFNGSSYASTNTHSVLGPIIDKPDIPSQITQLKSWISPPLIGAIIALILGMVPFLRHTILEEDGVLYPTITQSVKNLGELFVALQMFVVGAELALVPRASPGIVPSAYTLLVRFIVMPAVSILFVWGTAGRGWYVEDPLVWFLMILLPSGPSAMLLVSVAELADVSQGPIAGYLCVSYLFSPLVAVVVTVALKVVEAVGQR